MNDMNTAQVPETEPENKETPTMQDIEKKYFAPEQIENGSSYINQVIEICTSENAEPVFNFDPEAEFPAGYGLSVIPLTRRVPERGNVTYNVIIAAVPSLEAIAAETEGQNYINKLVTDSLIRQLTVAAKPKEEGALTSLPFKIVDFVTSARSSGLAAFNEVALDYVKALKNKGLKFMSKAMLRQVLSSAAFAEQQFPRVNQESWVLVINSMIKHVSDMGIDAGVLNHWLKTRDQVEIDTTEIDLSDLDSLV